MLGEAAKNKETKWGCFMFFLIILFLQIVEILLLWNFLRIIDEKVMILLLNAVDLLKNIEEIGMIIMLLKVEQRYLN